MATIVLSPSGLRTIKTSIVIPEKCHIWAKENRVSLSGTLTDAICGMMTGEAKQ